MSVALQCKPEELARVFSERQSKPLPPVEMINAPVHEVVKTGDEIDLKEVPVLTHYDVNAAPYITAGIVVAADPDTGARNTSYNRLMMAGPRELRIFMAVGRHLWTLHNKLERRNEPLPIAIVIGVHPLFSLGAQALTPANEDEYAVIGGMMNEPLRLVRAKTVSILVPADAEMIIEGQIMPNVRRIEGPFGEFTGHAVPQDRTAGHRSDRYHPPRELYFSRYSCRVYRAQIDGRRAARSRPVESRQAGSSHGHECLHASIGQLPLSRLYFDLQTGSGAGQKRPLRRLRRRHAA